MEMPKALLALFFLIFALYPVFIRFNLRDYNLKIGYEVVFIPIFLMFIMAQRAVKKYSSIRLGYFAHPFLLLFLASVFSLIRARDILFSIYALSYFILSSILYFYILCFFKTKKDYNFLLKIYFVVTAIICLTTLREIFSATGFKSISIFNLFSFGRRLIGGFSNPNSFSGFVVVSIPLIWGLKLPKRKIYTFMRYSLILFLILLLGFTYSRNGYIAFLGSSFILIFIYSIKKRKYKFIYLYLFFIIILAVFMYFINPGVIKRLLTIKYFEYDISAKQRIYMWINSLKIISENPIIGIGLFNFYLSPISFHSYTGPHNLLLCILVELGILGGIGIVLLLYKIFSRLLKLVKIPMDQEDLRMTVGLIGAWAAFFFHNIFDNVWNVVNHPRQILFLWFYLAITVLWIDKFLGDAEIH
jgi:O-antigen ligase